MVQSIRDKICQMLERNESAISKDDYARLVLYIDLLFDFAQAGSAGVKDE